MLKYIKEDLLVNIISINDMHCLTNIKYTLTNHSPSLSEKNTYLFMIISQKTHYELYGTWYILIP